MTRSIAALQSNSMNSDSLLPSDGRVEKYCIAMSKAKAIKPRNFGAKFCELIWEDAELFAIFGKNYFTFTVHTKSAYA